MMSCDHFTIRGAVAGFREKDWRLNCPYKLKPEAVLPPLTIPSFRWWYCDSCVQYLMKNTSGEMEMVTDVRNGLSSKHLSSLQPMVAGYRVVPSDIALFSTREDSSHGKTCAAAIVNDSSAIQPCGRTSLEHFRATTNTITDGQLALGDAPTFVGHTNDSGPCMSERQTALFDLNQIPDSETSELALMSDGSINDGLKESVDEAELQTESAEIFEPDSYAIVNDTTQRFNHCPLPETETSESPICEGAAVKRNPKYRSLADLLSVEGDKMTSVPSKRGIKVHLSPASDNKSKKKNLNIQEKQSPGCSMRRDAPEGKIRNRTVGSSLLKDNGREHFDVGVQLFLVPCGKRTEHKNAEADALSKTSFPTVSQQHKQKSATLNGAGNMLLPQKRRIFCMGKNANTAKSSLPIPNVVRKKNVSRKRVNHVQLSCKKMKQASAREDRYQELFGAKYQKKHISDVRPTVSEQRPANDIHMEVMMQLALRDRPPSSSQLVSLHSEGALPGMQMLSLVAAETAVPSQTAAFLNLDLGYSGCTEARVPTEFALTQQDGELFKLGPDDIPLRSRRPKYMPESVQEIEDSEETQ